MVTAAKTRLYPFFPAGAACTLCGEDVGACAVPLAGWFPPSPLSRDFSQRPPLAFTGHWGLSMASLCSEDVPFLLLLVGFGLVNYCWPGVWTLVVSIAPLIGMELWTIYVRSESFIFWPCFLHRMIYLYLCKGSVKTKYFRPRALEEKLY